MKSSSQPVSPDQRFGLYVHWPFCQAKCPYCDFNSHVTASVDQTDWALAYEVEIKRYAAEFPDLVLDTIFFGGGTPSLMDPAVVDRVISVACAQWRTTNAPEITLEANPTSVEIDRFRAYARAGVNRVSVGIQAMNDADLKRLGRMHSADEARRAFDAAAETFPAASFDLIYARQDQTLGAWETELSGALALGPTHLSLYQLTVEPGTAFGERHARGRLSGLPDEDLGADMYELTQSMCGSAGLPAYEISNHAAEGFESRHNLLYWTSGNWIGIGPGAHGRVGTTPGARVAVDAVKAPISWLAGVKESQGTHENLELLSLGEQLAEFAVMGLRLRDGVRVSRLVELGFDMSGPGLADLIDLGLIELEGTMLRSTSAGRPVLNAVITQLLAD